MEDVKLMTGGSAVDAARFVKSLVRDVRAGTLNEEDAILRLDERTVELLTKASLVDPDAADVIASGLPVSSGVATGKIYFSIEKCVPAAESGEPAILLTDSVRADDINGFGRLEGLLSLTEDPTSHASIIARVMEKPFVSKLRDSSWGAGKEYAQLGLQKVVEGDWVSVDAFSGLVYQGRKKVRKPRPPVEFEELYRWVGDAARLVIHGNADTPEEALSALENGGRGVEPRTEYMFFKPERLRAFRRMILGKSEEQRAQALSELLAAQREDFIRLFEVMGGLRVHVRLLDPPLHEFLPEDEAAKRLLAEDLNVDVKWLDAQIDSLREVNPMMGHRGARLLISRPAVAEMQARAVFDAALVMRRRGVEVAPVIVIPMVVDRRELSFLKRVIVGVHKEYVNTHGVTLPYSVGAMIETPRAALLAGGIAEEVDFLSFGTNDLTAQTFGFSRGDVLGKFLSKYLEEGILDHDPFCKLDESVSLLIRETVRKARSANPNIGIGLCGEQGGEAETIRLCHEIGLTSISCSPGRIPVAKLYAAQAAIEQQKNN
jgi:pyruvate,orthophosphate dikinase